MTRLDKLLAMLAEQPDDLFLQYALAMEWQGQGELEQAEAAFRKLLPVRPAYVPAWFMLGQLLAREDRIDEARDVLREGIDYARELRDHHAAGEMSEFLAALGQFGEAST